MADRKTTAPARADEEVHVEPVAPHLRAASGGKGAGPKSALKGGVGSKGEGPAGGAASTEGLDYSVQIHTDEKGLEVLEPIHAESGDEAAKIALERKDFKGASVRGVTVYSDPDPNSMGGERDAAIMIQNAKNGGAIINTLGTDANREAVEKLGRADIKELGE